ncbi:MAG: class I SAM-dependent methyltransferase [bacterium]
MSILSQVQQMYDEIGVNFSRTRQKTYGNGESTNWPVTDKYLARLKAGDSVLDIGCGNGRLISGLPTGVKYTGTDFSQTLLGEARKLYPGHDFCYGDVVDASHWDKLGQYEAIFCVAVLHHIPEKRQQLYVLKETKKHLKEGGFLYLTVWNLWQEKFLQYHLDDHVEVPYNKRWKRYCVALDVQILTDLMTESGWEIEDIFYADHEGNKADIMTGQNLVCVAR